MASFVYNTGKKSLGNGGDIDWVNDDIYVALLTSSYTPDKDNHQYFSDVSADEASGTGYTSEGFLLTNTAINIDNTNDRAEYDADDISESGLTITYRYYCVFKNTGTPSTSRLIALIDTGSDQVIDASTLSVAWSADGIFYLGE